MGLRRKAALSAEILATYGRVLVELRRRDIRTVADSLRGRSELHDDAARAAELGRAVMRVLDHAPRRSRCLVQSLVLTRMLARRGIASSLVIGVAPAGEFAAHAWIEAEGVPVLPPLASRFEPLTRV